MKEIKQFEQYFSAVRGRRPRTCKEYGKILEEFFRWKGDENIADVTKVVVMDYITHCDEKGNSASTRAAKVSVLKSFYNWAYDTDKCPTNPLAGLNRPKFIRPMPSFLSLDDTLDLLESVQGKKDAFYRCRNHTIITIFVHCGLRLSEMAGIRLRDIQEDRIAIRGKGGKERSAFLNNHCKEALSEWMKVRPSGSDYLFTQRSGERLLATSIANMVKSELATAGLDTSKYSTHSLRHTAATLLHRYGKVDIRVLQKVLGHASIATTEIYTHVVDDQVIEAMSNHPLA